MLPCQRKVRCVRHAVSEVAPVDPLEGWVRLQLAMMLRVVRTQKWRDVAWAALALGAAAWSGPYTLVFSALVDGVLVVAVARRTRLRIVASASAAVLALPIIGSAFTLVDQAPGGAGRHAMEYPPAVKAYTNMSPNTNMSPYPTCCHD